LIKKRFSFTKNKVVKDFSILFSGSVIAQIITLSISPIVSRIYTPEEFGILAVVVAMATFVSGIMTANYEKAIVIAEEDSDALHMFIFVVILTISFTIITSIAVIFFPNQINYAFNIHTSPKSVYFIPLIILFSGFEKGLNNWFTRYGKFKKISASTITRAGANTSKIALGFTIIKQYGLIISQIIAQIAQILILLHPFINKEKLNLKKLQKKRANYLIKKYKDFLRYTTPQSIGDMLYDKGLVFAFSAFYGTAALGLFNFGQSKMKKPVMLIRQNMSRIYFQRISKLNREGKSILKFSLKIYGTMILLILPVVLIFILWGPEIFSFIFGENWRKAGVIVQITSPWIALRFSASTISSIPYVFQKQKSFFLISIFFNLSFLSLLCILAIMQFEFIYNILLLSIYGSSFYLFLAIYLIYMIKREELKGINK
jgi:O-antigen/teichoic acid export membrane protein